MQGNLAPTLYTWIGRCERKKPWYLHTNCENCLGSSSRGSNRIVCL